MNRRIFIIINLSLLFFNLLFLTIIAPHPERIRMLDGYSKIAQGIAFAEKSIGTGIFAKIIFRKSVESKSSILSPLIFIFYNFFLIFLYFIAIKGLFILFKKTKGKVFNFLIFFTILYFVILPGPAAFSSFDRFRVPVMPFILFLASYGLFGGKNEKNCGGNACI